ncbi:hypothetical protein QBC41DRAFT_370208 [Cercophora samala]|uniref:Uncharacterized protein n=1 Tax=Cercophora samala TaxID=330535 RepID=A0AA39ZM20_9PEZI|nr:hypothetical protein QBC41DRAFT_370208 [Cercophora samala]
MSFNNPSRDTTPSLVPVQDTPDKASPKLNSPDFIKDEPVDNNLDAPVFTSEKYPYAIISKPKSTTITPTTGKAPLIKSQSQDTNNNAPLIKQENPECKTAATTTTTTTTTTLTGKAALEKLGLLNLPHYQPKIYTANMYPKSQEYFSAECEMLLAKAKKYLMSAAKERQKAKDLEAEGDKAPKRWQSSRLYARAEQARNRAGNDRRDADDCQSRAYALAIQAVEAPSVDPVECSRRFQEELEEYRRKLYETWDRENEESKLKLERGDA